MRYIARKHNLCGTTDEERYRCDLMTEQCMDFRNGWVRLCYGTWVRAALQAWHFNVVGIQLFVSALKEKAKDSYLADLPDKLKSFEDFLGPEEPWFAGKNITFVDFHMYELLVQHSKWAPEVLAQCKNLSAFVKRFEELPQIKAYMDSSRYD